MSFAYFPSPILGALKNVVSFIPGYSSIYYDVVFLTVPWSLLSLFTTLPALKDKWATAWVPWTWLVAYVHVIVTIITVYMLQTPQYLVENLVLRALFAGASGAIITWAIVAVIAKVWRWTRWIRRGGRLSMILLTRRL